MIDLHSHILPGLDDGPRSLDESLSIIQFAALDGVEKIAATPHVRHDYPTTPVEMQRALAEVRAHVSEAGLAVSILPERR